MLFVLIHKKKHMKRTTHPEISAASMADVAFQLLLFFIFATTMTTETGLLRKLPVDGEVTNRTFNDRDVLVVLVNRENQIMVEGQPADIADLRKTAREFIANAENISWLPRRLPDTIPYFGIIETTRFHVISLQSDRGTLYKTYLAVQNELTGAYNELRNELSEQKFKTSYADLKEEDPRKKAIDRVYPLVISEAEPKNIR
jgi:biopolymer transport protein ExbD